MNDHEAGFLACIEATASGDSSPRAAIDAWRSYSKDPQGGPMDGRRSTFFQGWDEAR